MPSDADQSLAGYPLLDDGTPFPGGVAYATRHPVRGNALLLRYRSEWFAPADSLDGFHDRARAAIGFQHPNVAGVFDTAFVGSDVVAVQEAFDGQSLEALVKNIGPMPTFMACEFARQIALGLAAAHARNLLHGDVRPAHLVVGPLIETDKTHGDGSPVFRPAEDATAKLFDLGLIPRRPCGREWAALDPLAAKALSFLPPERVNDGTTTAESDCYGLGASLFYLLTGRAPFVANSASGVIDAIATTRLAPLASLRPDLSPALVELVMSLLAREPGSRPSAASAADALAAFTAPEPEPVPLTPAPPEPAGWTVNEYTGHVSDSQTVFAPEAESASTGFESSDTVTTRPAPKTGITHAERAKLKMWFYIGGVFWFIAIILLLVLLSDFGCFNSGGGKTDTPTKKKR